MLAFFKADRGLLASGATRSIAISSGKMVPQ
jgi:hypothetical protein